MQQKLSPAKANNDLRGRVEYLPAPKGGKLEEITLMDSNQTMPGGKRSCA
jgi:hypothetical protein